MIEEVGTDEAGRLYIRPTSSQFQAIYRSAMEVHWDGERQVLYSPKPKDWDYLRWFDQILSAVAAEYGTILKVSQSTRWVNVTQDHRKEMESLSGSSKIVERSADLLESDIYTWDEDLTKQTLNLAAKAWVEGNYGKYVTILTPIRAKLSAVQLKRLTIAERRSGGN